MPAKRISDVLVLRVLLAHDPLTAAQICRLADIQRSVVNEGLRHLRAARRVYVSGFDETAGQGRERPIYAVGNMPDVAFVSKPGSEYSARYAARHREEIRMRDRRRRNGWGNPLGRTAP